MGTFPLSILVTVVLPRAGLDRLELVKFNILMSLSCILLHWLLRLHIAEVLRARLMASLVFLALILRLHFIQ